MTMTTAERTWNFGRLADAPAGPWSDEPDKVQWVDEGTDLDCLILRNRGGALCGYVGVPEGHPWFGAHYDACRVAPHDSAYETFRDWPEVHGGLTFSGGCHEDRGDDAICHVPYPGRTDKVWWVGFDTAHAGDLCPLHLRYGPVDGETYKTLDYVRAEVRELARQAANGATVAPPEEEDVD